MATPYAFLDTVLFDKVVDLVFVYKKGVATTSTPLSLTTYTPSKDGLFYEQVSSDKLTKNAIKFNDPELSKGTEDLIASDEKYIVVKCPTEGRKPDISLEFQQWSMKEVLLVTIRIANLHLFEVRDAQAVIIEAGYGASSGTTASGLVNEEQKFRIRCDINYCYTPEPGPDGITIISAFTGSISPLLGARKIAFITNKKSMKLQDFVAQCMQLFNSIYVRSAKDASGTNYLTQDGKPVLQTTGYYNYVHLVDDALPQHIKNIEIEALPSQQDFADGYDLLTWMLKMLRAAVEAAYKASLKSATPMSPQSATINYTILGNEIILYSGAAELDTSNERIYDIDKCTSVSYDGVLHITAPWLPSLTPGAIVHINPNYFTGKAIPKTAGEDLQSYKSAAAVLSDPNTLWRVIGYSVEFDTIGSRNSMELMCSNLGDGYVFNYQKDLAEVKAARHQVRPIILRNKDDSDFRELWINKIPASLRGAKAYVVDVGDTPQSIMNKLFPSLQLVVDYTKVSADKWLIPPGQGAIFPNITFWALIVGATVNAYKADKTQGYYVDTRSLGVRVGSLLSVPDLSSIDSFSYCKDYLWELYQVYLDEGNTYFCAGQLACYYGHSKE